MESGGAPPVAYIGDFASTAWFDAGQSWPEPDDAAAFNLMRDVMQAPRPFLAAADGVRDRIGRVFGTGTITAQLREAIGSVVPHLGRWR